MLVFRRHTDCTDFPRQCTVASSVSCAQCCSSFVGAAQLRSPAGERARAAAAGGQPASGAAAEGEDKSPGARSRALRQRAAAQHLPQSTRRCGARSAWCTSWPRCWWTTSTWPRAASDCGHRPPSPPRVSTSDCAKAHEDVSQEVDAQSVLRAGFRAPVDPWVLLEGVCASYPPSISWHGVVSSHTVSLPVVCRRCWRRAAWWRA